MRKTNWASVEKSTKNIKKAVKNLQKVGVFFKEFPEDGYMIDEKKVKNEVGIARASMGVKCRWMKSVWRKVRRMASIA